MKGRLLESHSIELVVLLGLGLIVFGLLTSSGWRPTIGGIPVFGNVSVTQVSPSASLILTGRVVNVSVSAGGFGHSDLTTIKLEDGTSFTVRGANHLIVIGKTYRFGLDEYVYSASILRWKEALG